MKKITDVIVDMIICYLSMLLVSFIANQIGWMEGNIFIYSSVLTIGWVIAQFIIYFYKYFLKRKRADNDKTEIL